MGSRPGYGLSGKPTTTGWDPIRIARAWIVLMKRLGHTRFVAQGGDWGNAVTEQMALLAPPELIGIHTNKPATVPADIDKAAFAGAAAPVDLSAEERHAYDQLAFLYNHGLGYANEMMNRRRGAGRSGRIRSSLLQPAGQRRPLRGVGAAAALHVRDARGVQITPQLVWRATCRRQSRRT